jgi:xylulokinase
MQKKRYFLGIDLGTSAIKLVLIDADQKLLAHHRVAYEISEPAFGWREIDPDVWFQCLVQGLDELFTAFDAGCVDAIGVTGQMHTLVMLDERGQSLRPAMMWDDTRTRDIVAELRSEISQQPGAAYLARTISTGSPAANLRWLSMNEPENFSCLSKFLIAPDYLVYRLTGKTGTDYCEASTSCLYDIERHEWSGLMREILHLDPKVYPEVRGSAVVAGKLIPEIARRFHFREDVEVLTGTGDNPATALSSGCLGLGYPVISLGTSGVLMMRSDKLEPDAKGKTILFSADGKNFSHLMQGALQSNGTAYEWWMRSILGVEDFDGADRILAKRPPQQSQLLFFPHLMGEKTVFSDPDIRGAFLGLSTSTTREDMLAAVLEGLSFGYRQLAEAMRLDLNACDGIRVVGGGARSDFWVQTLANVLNTEVQQMDGFVSPALGIALLAAYAHGVIPSMERIADVSVKMKRRFLPDPQMARHYSEMYPRYKRIFEAVKFIYC